MSRKCHQNANKIYANSGGFVTNSGLKTLSVENRHLENKKIEGLAFIS